MEHDYSAVGSNVKRIRKSRKITQEALSEMSDISTQYLCRIENGARVPSLETVYKLAKALEVETDMLFGIKTKMEIDYQDELKHIFQDCNDYEKYVIGEVLVNLKSTLRKNLPLLGKDK